MADTLYFDNDADLIFKKIPENATVNWAVTTMANAGSRPVVPVNLALSGIATYNAAKRRFEDVIEGDDITQYLTPTDPVTNTPLYAIVYWWGANIRKVKPNVVVKAIRE